MTTAVWRTANILRRYTHRIFLFVDAESAASSNTLTSFVYMESRTSEEDIAVKGFLFAADSLSLPRSKTGRHFLYNERNRIYQTGNTHTFRYLP